MTPFLPLARLAALTAAALALAGCNRTPPPAEHRLLVLDGIEITLAEAEPYVAFLDSFMPEFGRKTKLRRVVEEHLLPLAVARREFGPQRKEQLELAKQLCSVATNAHELEQQTQQFKDKRRSNMTRLQAKLPVSMFLFDQLQMGAASAPIELPQGYFVVATFDLTRSAMALDDFVDALQIGFVTHTAGEWYEWYEAQKPRLAGKATFVHPDYRDAIPDWIQLPKQP